MKFTVGPFLVALAFFAFSPSKKTNTSAKASEAVDLKDLPQIILDHFSDDKYVYLYRGFGPDRPEFNNTGRFAIHEVDKWFDKQGLVHGFTNAHDGLTEDQLMVFTPTLVYAGRYSGSMMWDKSHGILRIKIPKELYKKFDHSERGLSYDEGMPHSVHEGGWDAFDPYLAHKTPKTLPFIGSFYPIHGSIYGPRPIALDKKLWKMSCNNPLPDRFCWAIEVRIRLGSVLEMAKAADPLVVERVTWKEFVKARLDYFALKSLFWQQGIEDARSNFVREEGVYEHVCGVEPKIDCLMNPKEPCQLEPRAPYCSESSDLRTDFCAKLCDLHSHNPRSSIFTSLPTNRAILGKALMKFKSLQEKNVKNLESYCQCT